MAFGVNNGMPKQFQPGGVPAGYPFGQGQQTQAPQQSFIGTPYYQPYMPNPTQFPSPQMPQMSQTPPSTQQAPQSAAVIGRFVNSETEIAAVEVPIDGSTLFYPLVDGSGVIAKTWDMNEGVLRTIRFVPESGFKPVMEATAVPEDNLPGYVVDIQDRLSRIESLLKPHTRPKSGLIVEGGV